MKKILFVAICTLALVGCNNESAPDISDVKNIVIEGKKYTPREYLGTFCKKKDSPSDANCIKADKQRIAEMSGIKKIDPVW